MKCPPRQGWQTPLSPSFSYVHLDLASVSLHVASDVMISSFLICKKGERIEPTSQGAGAQMKAQCWGTCDK